MDIEKEREAFEDVFPCSTGTVLNEYGHYESQVNQKDAMIQNISWVVWQAAKAQAVPEWINVDDRLPNRQVNVLVASKHDFVCIASLTNNHKNNKFYDGDGLAINSITHWMPLPDAPLEQAND